MKFEKGAEKPLKKRQLFEDKSNLNKPEKDFLDIYFSVSCKVCSTEIGVYEFEEKIYHFFNVYPGYG